LGKAFPKHSAKIKTVRQDNLISVSPTTWEVIALPFKAFAVILVVRLSPQFALFVVEFFGDLVVHQWATR
jgi:hypothetical protein